ncbi:MAG TPA: hypothetical protein VGE58_00075 [Daejeonella sp.]
MKKYLYLLVIYSILFAANIHLVKAQYSEDFRAKAVLEKQYVDIKGSPFLNEDWAIGVVKMANGSTIKDMSLKFDQVSGELIFKSRDGKTMGFADRVSEFSLADKNKTPRLFRNGYKTGEANSETSFYEVLYDGGTILLKDPKKNIVEHRAYNSSTVVKSIVETPVYYLQVNGALVKVKKDKKAILSVLGNSAQLEKYIQDNKLNLKDDSDLAKLMLYYDSIKS